MVGSSPHVGELCSLATTVSANEQITLSTASHNRMFTHSMPPQKGIGVDPERGWRRRVDDLRDSVILSRMPEEESKDAHTT